VTSLVFAVTLLAAACGSKASESTRPAGAVAPVSSAEPSRSATTEGSSETSPTAIGTGSPGDSASGGDAENAAPDDPTADATRTVLDHRGRAIEVPDRPVRVVSLDVSGTLHLALLGLDVISAPIDLTDVFDSEIGAFVPDGVVVDDYEVVGIGETLNLEAIAALRPELIIGFDTIDIARPEAFDVFSRIAPTVFYEFGDNGDWRDRARAEAMIIGRLDELAEFEERYDDALAGVPTTDATVAFVRLELDDSGNWRLEHPTASIPGSIATAAGLEVFTSDGTLGELNDTGSFYAEISAERLDALTADVIIVQDLSTFGQGDPIEAFSQNPLWPGLPAVRAGRVVALPTFVFNGGTYATAVLTLEALARAMS
jgi:iron complex transport system substrate-binding protein